MFAQLIGYARTSTIEQTAGLGAQLAALQEHGCTKLYQEQTSAVGNRPELERAIDYSRDGDTLVCTKLDRLARSVSDLLKIIERLEAKGVSLRILDFGGSALDTKGPTGKLMLTLIGAIGQFERELMLERQRAGIAAAKAEGKYKGRAPTARGQATTVMELHRDGVKPNGIADALNMSRSSVFRILKEGKASAAFNQDASSPNKGSPPAKQE